LSNVVAVVTGFFHSLALRSDGTVAAWGTSTNINDIGTGDSYGQAVVPTGLSNVVAVAGGGWHSVALRSDGSVKAWGRDDYGQAETPAGLSNVVAVAAGAAHNTALRADGTVAAWGFNTYGQTNVPAGLSNVVQVAAGSVNSLALVGQAPPVNRIGLVNPAWTSNGFEVSLPTRNGRVYALEFKSSLTGTNWTQLPLRAGRGGKIEVIDTIAAGVQRYYRVRRW
jgi:hypothetical protein